MKTISPFITLLILLFLVSCSGIYDSDDLKAGYIFEPQDSYDTKTVDDFEIIDTMEDFERYIIIDPGDPDLIKGGDFHSGDIPIHISGSDRYGIANFDNQFIVCPDFMYLSQLKDGYFVGLLPGGFKNPVEGILHVRGEMITDFKYKSINLKDNTDSVKCSYRVDGDWFVDWVVLE